MNFLHSRALLLLRISLGIVFFWSGILTLFNVSPILPLLTKSLPNGIGHSQLFIFLVALFELSIGLSYLINRFVKLASIVMCLSLFIMSIPVIIVTGFDPRFPILSLAGEVTLKNIVLISAGLIMISENTDLKENPQSPDKKSLKE